MALAIIAAFRSYTPAFGAIAACQLTLMHVHLVVHEKAESKHQNGDHHDSQSCFVAGGGFGSAAFECVQQLSCHRAALSFADRLRGLSRISAGDASSGVFVRTCHPWCPLNAFLTIRSSSE